MANFNKNGPSFEQSSDQYDSKYIYKIQRIRKYKFFFIFTYTTYDINDPCSNEQGLMPLCNFKKIAKKPINIETDAVNVLEEWKSKINKQAKKNNTPLKNWDNTIITCIDDVFGSSDKDVVGLQDMQTAEKSLKKVQNKAGSLAKKMKTELTKLADEINNFIEEKEKKIVEYTV